ncbi:MAG: patatin-like phospholipase family protein [Actinomycetota bacterium]|nr:patatin-like phospholipase family protein [Actinomycetota bacterium]
MKGVFPASFLATVEDAVGDRVANYFDLIVGTSTGGIIALGLGLGLSADDILRFYGDSGSQIFGGNRTIRSIRSLRTSKYSDKPLKSALESVFGEKKLGESSKRLVIPSFNLENGEVYIYKTAHHPRFERDYKLGAVDVALATAAAPTFFPTHRSAMGTPLIDGGVWANNPTGLAVVEAIGVLNWPKESIRVLSLGCTSEPFDAGKARFWPRGLGYWAPKIVDLFMTAQSSSSLGTAHVLLGHDKVLRVNPRVPTGRYGLDTFGGTRSLEGLGSSEARGALPEIRHMFIDEGPTDKFEPHNPIAT